MTATRHEHNSTLDLAEAARLIREAGSATVVTHAKPDGDAIGSVVALVAALRHLGLAATGRLVGPVPASLLPLIGNEPVCVLQPGEAMPDAALVVIVDTGAYVQLGPIADWVRARLDRTLILDHHLSGDVAAAHRWVDGDAAACAEIIAALLDHLAEKPGIDGPERRTGRIGTRADDWHNPLYSQTVRDALFAGIASDTGWFRFSNTRPTTHELAARLIRLGVDHADLYARLEQTERPQKLALLIRALDSLELVGDGRVAIMTLRAADFADTGALLEETERFVDLPQSVATVQVVVLVTETPPEHLEDRRSMIRISFRSKPGVHAVNVAKLAEQFGGGGHARAAGAKVAGSLADVLGRIREAAAHLIEATDSSRPGGG